MTSEQETPTTRLVLVLAAFFVVGGTMALFIWHTLSDFLAGRPVEGGAYLLALGLLIVFAGFTRVLAVTVRRITGETGQRPPAAS